VNVCAVPSSSPSIRDQVMYALPSGPIVTSLNWMSSSIVLIWIGAVHVVSVMSQRTALMLASNAWFGLAGASSKSLNVTHTYDTPFCLPTNSHSLSMKWFGAFSTISLRVGQQAGSDPPGHVERMFGSLR
jgi:hypothetical protein